MKKLVTPGMMLIAGCDVEGPVEVTFEGRAVPTRLWDRLVLAFDLVFRPSRVVRLYRSEVLVAGCTITSAPGVEGIRVRERAA